MDWLRCLQTGYVLDRRENKSVSIFPENIILFLLNKQNIFLQFAYKADLSPRKLSITNEISRHNFL